MLFGLETVEIMAVAALTSRYVKSSQRPFNIRPALFMIRRIFPLCNCPLNLKRARFILAPRDSDNDFRIFQLSLDPTLNIRADILRKKTVRLRETLQKRGDSTYFAFFFFKKLKKEDNAKRLETGDCGII